METKLVPEKERHSGEKGRPCERADDGGSWKDRSMRGAEG